MQNVLTSKAIAVKDYEKNVSVLNAFQQKAAPASSPSPTSSSPPPHTHTHTKRRKKKKEKKKIYLSKNPTVITSYFIVSFRQPKTIQSSKIKPWTFTKCRIKSPFV